MKFALCRVGWVVSVAIAFTLAGCSSGPTFGTVKGQVLANGKPADKVRVEFHPDALKKTTGPMSVGETDADGRFTLTYTLGDQAGEGAVVGWHKVVLQDLRLAESETGKGIPVRFGSEHSTVLTTPVEIEVKKGDQSPVIEVPVKK